MLLSLRTLILLAFLTGGCTLLDSAPDTLDEDISISIDVDANDGRPRITGRTNLPTGTKLIASVAAQDWVDAETREGGYSDAFMGQDETSVGRDGTFVAGPFGPDPGGLPSGRYRARVTVPIPHVQPAKVKDALGAQGEYMRGPLVEREAPGLGKVAKIEEFFSVR